MPKIGRVPAKKGGESKNHSKQAPIRPGKQGVKEVGKGYLDVMRLPQNLSFHVKLLICESEQPIYTPLIHIVPYRLR